MLRWIARCGIPKITSATFFSDLLKNRGCSSFVLKYSYNESAYFIKRRNFSAIKILCILLISFLKAVFITGIYYGLWLTYPNVPSLWRNFLRNYELYLIFISVSSLTVLLFYYKCCHHSVMMTRATFVVFFSIKTVISIINIY